jgi:integral membrane sensor domain MASE1
LALLLPAYIAFTYLGNSTYLPGDPYWIVWPANGLLFGFLAVIPRRSWPYYLCFTWTAAVAITHWANGMPLVYSLLVPTYDTLEPMCGLLLLRRFAGEDFSLDRPINVGRFLLYVAFGPTIVSSFFGATTLYLVLGEPFLVN